MASVRITGAEEITKVLDGLDGRDRQNLLRRAVRAGSKPFQAALSANAAARSDVPKSFRKVPAAKVSASMRRGGDIVAVVRPKSPLFNIFQPGAGEHDIAGDFMFGQVGSATWEPAGRKRPDTFAAHGSVRHPGLKARDMLGPAFAVGHAAASKAFADVIFGR